MNHGDSGNTEVLHRGEERHLVASGVDARPTERVGTGTGGQVGPAAAGWGAGCSRHPNPLSPPGDRAKSTSPTLQPKS